MNFIDFTKIDSSLDWENFAEAFFKVKGYNIIERPSVGSDGGTGKDLIIEETLPSEFGNIKRNFLVSCKHFAKSGKTVNAKDENANVFRNIIAEKCTGFIGFYSTSVSSPLQKIIRNLGDNIVGIYYDAAAIESFLLFEDKDNLLLKHFFSDAYKKWKNLGSNDPEQNSNFSILSENCFKNKNKEYFRKYYEGQPADWSIIRKYTFKRDCFKNVIQQLESNNVCLLTGAGGEGKTTLLQQVGDYYLGKGLCVLYSFDAIKNVNLSSLKFNPNKSYLIILDNANDILNLTAFVKNVKFSKNVLLLLASRKNEWDYSLFNRNDKQDLGRWIGEIINLQKLTNNEIIALIGLLQKHNVINEGAKEKLSDFIEENTNSNFLLAIMIYATQGKSFDLIIKGVIDKIRDWKDSKQTIEAIGYIVCIEVLGKGAYGRQVYCHETLLKNLIKINYFKEYQTIKAYLSQEAFFQGSLTDTIHTRNPEIAKIYYNYLFESDEPLLDKYEFYYDIIRECSISSRKEKDVLALIPPYFMEKNEGLAIELLKYTISCGFFLNTFYQFIDKEILKENNGVYNSQDYSVRWLFEKAFEKNSKNPHLFQMWGKLEMKLDNIGDVNTMFSARWIFLKGVTLLPHAELFVIWANIEMKVNNIGRDIDDEYTARWICNEGTKVFPKSNLFVTWANIEANIRNIGKLVDGNFEKYTARWVCWEGLKHERNHDLYTTWANIEANIGNIGKLVDGNFEKYTARWICVEGLKYEDNYNLYTTWANIEANIGNIGKLVDGNFEKFTARWICIEGLKKVPTHALYSTWVNIELTAGNIGNSITDIYTSRWILNEGFNKTKHFQVLLKWIKLELSENNIGDDITPYSAKWLYEILKNNFDFTDKLKAIRELDEIFNKSQLNI